MPPLKKNDIIELKIEKSTADQGKFIARIDNYVVFIPRTIIGETVKAKITKVKKNYAEAFPLTILTPSKHRIMPKCPHYTECSGCQYQHINYDYQLEIKKMNLIDILNKIGNVHFPEKNISIIPSPQPFFYRNKIKFKIKNDTIGFLSTIKHRVIDIDQCYLAKKEINELYTFIKENEDLSQYNHLYLKYFDKPVAYLEKDRRIFADKANRLLTTTLQDKNFTLPLTSFFQTNSAVLDRFIDEVKTSLNPNTNTMLIDLFCGVGFFATLFSDTYTHVYGVDIDKQAIKYAKTNLKENNISNVTLFSNTAEKGLTDILNKICQQDTSLIIDPPRSGISNHTLTKIRNSSIHKIVYVSCYPATLARDIKILSQKYKLTEVKLVDMFPQTAHIEIIATLEKSKN